MRKVYFALLLALFSLAGCGGNGGSSAYTAPPTTNAAAPSITSSKATAFTVGTASSFSVTATGTPVPTLLVSGALPQGVSFNPATGVLAGTPTAAGIYSLFFTASNGVSPATTQIFTLTVVQPASPGSLGAKWSEVYSPVTQYLNGVVWSGSQFIAVGNTGTILTSSDGLAWMTRTSGSTETLQSIAWSGTKYAVVGGWNGTVLLSADGITWSKVSTGVGTFLRKIVWANNQFVAVGTGTILTSPDGTTWTKRSVNTVKEISNVVWTGDQYVAIGGSNGTVGFTSPDGVTWTSQSGLPSLFSGMLFGLVSNGSKMIASGWGGFFASSSDGVTWSSGIYGSNNLYAATWANQHFIEVGDNGTIITSVDGNTWDPTQSNTTDVLSDITCSDNMCIVVGGTTTRSTILVSQ